MLQRRRVASLLAVVFAATWAPQVAFGSPEAGKTYSLAQAVRRSILVYPIDVTGANVPAKEEISSLLTDVVRSRLIASDAYAVALFHRSLPPIARLHNDQQLSDTDVNPPFAEDNAKAARIARLAGYDLVFIGSVDGYNVADNKGEMTVSGRILEVGTGKIVRSATLSASSSQNATAAEVDRANEAARSAGERLATQLAPQVVRAPVTTTTTTTTTTRARRRNNTPLIIGGAVLLIAIAAAASD